MTTPFSYSRRLKPYAEQMRERDRLIDGRRRARNRFLAVALILVLAVIAGYFMREPAAAEPATTTIIDNGRVWKPIPVEFLTIGGVSINLKDGNVTLPANKSMNEASKDFWRTVSAVYPQIKAEICR